LQLGYDFVAAIDETQINTQCLCDSEDY